MVNKYKIKYKYIKKKINNTCYYLTTVGKLCTSSHGYKITNIFEFLLGILIK